MTQEVSSSASTTSTGVVGALPSPGYYFEASIEDGANHANDDCSSLTNDEDGYTRAALGLDIELGRLIANGNFGHVYYGVLSSRLEVCVKFLKPPQTPRQQETQIINFQREVLLMSHLDHPHIMPLVASATAPYMVIVTKFMSGGNLFHLIHSGTVSDDLVLLRIVADVASAMSYLHSCEPPVVHRDLTSPNVLIDADGRAHVSDFGLAKIKHPQLLPSGQRGNLSWLAPEALYQTAFEMPCDVYSFGVILWEVTTRLVPYAGCSRHEIETAKRAGNAPGPIPEACPPAILQLIELCLHINPASRPSFELIWQGLEQLLAEVTRLAAAQQQQQQHQQQQQQQKQ